MRGFTWNEYVADDGRVFAVRVDDDYASEFNRGWNRVGTSPPPVLPRGWLPRIVVGQDDTGRLVEARIGRVGAPLWNGSVTTFRFERSDLTSSTATVIRRIGERPVVVK